MSPEFLSFVCVFTVVNQVWVQLAKGDESAKNEENAVDFKTTDNIHIKFPCFSPAIRSFDDDTREMLIIIDHHISKLRDETIEIMEYLDKLIGRMLVDSPNKISVLGWIGVTKDLYNIATKRSSPGKKESKALGARSGFNGYMRDFFARMLTESKEIENKLVSREAPKDVNKLREELHKTIQAIISSLNSSPVVMYYGWADGSIDGVPFEQHAANLMGGLRYHGYSGILGAIDKLMSFVLMFDQFG